MSERVVSKRIFCSFSFLLSLPLSWHFGRGTDFFGWIFVEGFSPSPSIKCGVDMSVSRIFVFWKTLLWSDLSSYSFLVRWVHASCSFAVRWVCLHVSARGSNRPVLYFCRFSVFSYSWTDFKVDFPDTYCEILVSCCMIMYYTQAFFHFPGVLRPMRAQNVLFKKERKKKKRKIRTKPFVF